MSTIVTRAGKGSALTHNEVDANFNNLNNDKIEAAQTVTLTNKTLSTGTAITDGTINNATIGASTPSSGAFTTLSATGVTTVQAGTVSAPAITTSGDTNTGIYFPAADTIAFTEGGVESMRITSAGDVGIGTSSPGGRFHVSDSSNGSTVDIVLSNTYYAASSTDEYVTFQGEFFQNDVSANRAAGYMRFGKSGDFASSANASAYLSFATRNAGLLSEKMRLDSSGNLGLGVTPSAWGSGYSAIDLNNRSAVVGTSGGVTNVVANAYFNGTSWIYKASDAAGRYQQDSGLHKWFNAPSGTAGNAITFTQAMTLNASGNLGVGTTSPGVRLDVGGSSTALLSNQTSAYAPSANSTATSFKLFNESQTNGAYASLEFWVRNANANINIAYIASPSTSSNDVGTLVFGRRTGANTSAESARITSAGEVLVGGTTAISADSGCLSIQRAGAATLNLFRNDTTVSSTNVLGSIAFYGNDTTANAVTNLAYIQAVASGDHAAGDNPTDLVFGCTNDGSGTVAEFARLGQGGTSYRYFEVRQPTLTDTQPVFLRATGGTAGTVNRNCDVGVYKHSGITNACAYIGLACEDAANNYLWADNSDVLRISTTASNIGTTGGTVVGTQTSDERIKNIIGPVTYGLEQIKSINPVEFTLKDDVEQTKRIGFIAQQVQPIVPESVYDTKEVIVEGEPTKLGMEYVSLIPVLVKAMQEQQVMIDELKAKVAALENA